MALFLGMDVKFAQGLDVKRTGNWLGNRSKRLRRQRYLNQCCLERASSRIFICQNHYYFWGCQVTFYAGRSKGKAFRLSST
jgi:hypothetical protein